MGIKAAMVEEEDIKMLQTISRYQATRLGLSLGKNMKNKVE